MLQKIERYPREISGHIAYNLTMLYCRNLNARTHSQVTSIALYSSAAECRLQFDDFPKVEGRVIPVPLF